jgi:UDP-N-acetylglucosamine enolpyruvyl transferase
MALSYLGGGKINLLPPVESRPYIDMTLQTLRTFGADIKEENNTFYINSGGFKGCNFTVEADWSNAAPFICMGAEVTVLDPDSTQGDKAIIEVLKKMGAEIEVADNAAHINGVPSLQGASVRACDLRAGAALIIAALAADGISTVTGLEFVDRGYQDLTAKLRSLGANIQRVTD